MINRPCDDMHARLALNLSFEIVHALALLHRLSGGSLLILPYVRQRSSVEECPSSNRNQLAVFTTACLDRARWYRASQTAPCLPFM